MVGTKAIETNIPEIDARLKKIGGDMLKIEYLENSLKQTLANDVRRFCHLKLADLYSGRMMIAEAAKNMGAAAECATTYKDKMQLYVNESLLWTKKAEYANAENAFKKAMACGNAVEKEQIKQQMKKEYFSTAEGFEKREKRNAAIVVYERIMALPFITQDEKDRVVAKLAKLCSSVGKIPEAMRYEAMMKK
jgi:tetratricopeptide (TPR) repeat protein